MYKLVLEKKITEFDQTEGGIEAHFLRRLRAQLDELDHACRLTPAQTKKLELAGRAEIKRWMDRLDRVGQEFVDSATGDVGALRDEIDKLLADADGLFRSGSYLSKTVVATLNQEQLRAGNAHRYEQAVSRTVRKLARSIHMSDEQSDTLSKVLLNETKPPSEFGQLDYALVLFLASRLPESSLRGIFDESQWKMFQRQVASGAATEAFLKREGYEFGDQVLHSGPASSEPKANPAKSKNQGQDLSVNEHRP